MYWAQFAKPGFACSTIQEILPMSSPVDGKKALLLFVCGFALYFCSEIGTNTAALWQLLITEPDYLWLTSDILFGVL